MNKKGFTLTEMLLALLLMSIAFVGISGSIVAISTAYERVSLTSEAQILLSTAADEITSDIHNVTSVKEMDVDDDGTPETYYYCEDRGVAIRYENSDKGIMVVSTDGNKISLVTQATNGKGLYTEIIPEPGSTELLYEDEIGAYHFTLAVRTRDKVLISTPLVLRPMTNKGE